MSFMHYVNRPNARELSGLPAAPAGAHLCAHSRTVDEGCPACRGEAGERVYSADAFEIGSWTRSTQKIDGHSIIIDVRPDSRGGSFLTTYQNDLSGVPVQCGGLPRVPASLGLKSITLRLDSSLYFRQHELTDVFTRALESHAAGVRVEVMGLNQVGRPAGLISYLSRYYVTVKGSGGRRPVRVPARVVATSHKTGKISVDGYGWTSLDYVNAHYRPAHAR